MKKSNKKRNNKKAEISWLSGHTMNIIVAVLCILVLVYIGYQIYNLFSEKSDLEKTQGNLKAITNRVSLIHEKPLNPAADLLVYSPLNWVFRSYTSNFPKAECYGKKSCLCICKDPTCEGSVPKVCNGYDYVIEITDTYTDPGNIITWSKSYPNAILFGKAVEGLKIYSSGDKISITKDMVAEKNG